MTTTREIVREMTQGQLKDIATTLIGAIPALSFDEAQAAISDKSSLVAGVREVFLRWKNSEPRSTEASVTTTIVAPSIPAENEPFTLEVDNDQDPMDIVTSACLNKRGWEYLGPKRTGKSFYTDVRLVRLGHCKNHKDAEKKADKLGCRLLEGQARESFKAKYSAPEGKDPIIFGGSEWQSPDGHARVTGLYECGGRWGSVFEYSDRAFRDRYRWAVVSK